MIFSHWHGWQTIGEKKNERRKEAPLPLQRKRKLQLQNADTLINLQKTVKLWAFSCPLPPISPPRPPPPPSHQPQNKDMNKVMGEGIKTQWKWWLDKLMGEIWMAVFLLVPCLCRKTALTMACTRSDQGLVARWITLHRLLPGMATGDILFCYLAWQQVISFGSVQSFYRWTSM